MVLEEAAAAPTADDVFTQDGPASDIEPYASSDSSSLKSSGHKLGHKKGYIIPVHQLPLVMIPFPRTVGPGVITAINQHLVTVQNIVRRRLRQEEVDALAYHFVNGMRITSFAFPIGIVAGCAQGYRTSENFTFPFWQPKKSSWFNPDKLGPLTGREARYAWSIARYTAYGFVGCVIATVFFGSYSVSVTGAGRATDPRLKDFNQALKARVQEARNDVTPIEQGQRRPITSQEGGMDSQVQKARGVLERSRERQSQKSVTVDDDMSPTSGAWAADDQSSRSSTDGDLMSDDQMRQQTRQDRRQRIDRATLPTKNRDSTVDTNNVTSQPNSSDDASPQTGADSQKQLPAGSAWERIRKEASAGHKKPSQEQRQGRTAGWGSVQREQQQDPTQGDGFSFSNSEEERHLAKTEAQQDFDARLERERQGGDFNTEGRRGRW